MLYLEQMLFRGAYLLSRGLLSSGARRETSPLIHYCSSELVLNTNRIQYSSLCNAIYTVRDSMC